MINRTSLDRFIYILLLLAAGTVNAGERPNLVFVIADDCTFRDLGCYGGQAHTPHIDRLADEGMRFTRCFQSAPMCSPTRHNIYTGQYPVKSGAYPNHTFVDSETESIVQYLKPLGYRVAHSGKSHVSPRSVFDWESIPGAKNPEFEKVDGFLSECSQADNPFCLLLCSNEPHSPWNKGDASRYPPSEIKLPPYFVDTPETRKAMSNYLAEITYYDDQVGQTIALLEKHSLSDETLLIVVSEQGSSMPFAKWTCYDSGLQSGFIAHWPGKIQPGTVNPAMIEYVDILPTFIEAAGGTPATVLDGRSLLPVFAGKQKHKKFVFGEMTTRGINNGSDHYGIRSVRSERFKYIWNFTPDVKFENACTQSTEFQSWIRAADNGDVNAKEWVRRYQHRSEVELYDVMADPLELKNLADESQFDDVKEKLRSELDAWMKRCGDQGQITELDAMQRQGRARKQAETKKTAPKAATEKKNKNRVRQNNSALQRNAPSHQATHLVSTTTASSTVTPSQPNVLLLFIDDLKPMTRDYGHTHMQTPNFDRLASGGLRFENAYCQVPTCGASRASLMTSLYPTVDRFPNFLTWAERDAPNQPTLPQKFRDAGYHTLSNGKVFHHHRDTEERSWSEPAWRPSINGVTYYNDETTAFMETVTETRGFAGSKAKRKKVPMFELGQVDPMKTVDGLIAAKTIADLKRMSDEDKPFFIACGFAKPHMPFYSPAETYAKYPLESIALAGHRKLPLPTPTGLREVKEQNAYLPMTHDFSRRLEYNSDDYHRHMRQGYYASVSHADDLMGRILDEIDSLGLADNTLIVAIGDHGWSLGENNQWAKNQLMQEALRTAMWMRGPGVPQNAAVDGFVEFVDIYPTLCELAGIDTENHPIHGKSFTGLLHDPASTHRSDAYTRFATGDAISSKDHFYVRWRGNTKQNVLLVDRATDPLAKKNVANEPSFSIQRETQRSAVDARVAIAESAIVPAKVSQRPLQLSATIDHAKPNGVIFAQGGNRFGYALTVVHQRPLLAVRNQKKLVQIQSVQPISGQAKITANITEDRIELLVNGKIVAEGDSPGLLAEEPAGALFHSEDRGDLVGEYPQQPFNGRILSHSVTSSVEASRQIESGQIESGQIESGGGS